MEQGGSMRSKKDTSNLQVYQGPLPTKKRSPAVLIVRKREIPQSYAKKRQKTLLTMYLIQTVRPKCTGRKVDCSLLIYFTNIDNNLPSYNTSRLQFPAHSLPQLHRSISAVTHPFPLAASRRQQPNTASKGKSPHIEAVQSNPIWGKENQKQTKESEIPPASTVKRPTKNTKLAIVTPILW